MRRENLLNSKFKEVVLASASPRRHSLLKGLDIPVRIISPDEIDEVFPETMPVNEVPLFLARSKADANAHHLGDDQILLTADTVVVHDNSLIVKPVDREDARRMLQKLSGSMHRVLTGVCLRSVDREKCFMAETKVWFGQLTREEIQYYVETYEPFDKAGSYGIQEWIGYAAIERIEGSFYNVMGLPVHLVYRYLKEFNQNK